MTLCQSNTFKPLVSPQMAYTPGQEFKELMAEAKEAWESTAKVSSADTNEDYQLPRKKALITGARTASKLKI